MQQQSVFKIKTNEVVAYTAAAGNSAACPLGINVVRVHVTSAAHIAIGKTAVATTSDALVPANVPEYFRVFEGERVSAIQNAVGGNVHVTYMTL